MLKKSNTKEHNTLEAYACNCTVVGCQCTICGGPAACDCFVPGLTQEKSLVNQGDNSANVSGSFVNEITRYAPNK